MDSTGGDELCVSGFSLGLGVWFVSTKTPFGVFAAVLSFCVTMSFTSFTSLVP